MPSRTRRCSTCCATISSSMAPNTAAAGLHRRTGGSVRLLRERHDHGGGRPAQSQSATAGGGRAGGARRQSLPLRHAQPDHPRRPARRATERQDLTMDAPRLTRRDFTAALGGIVLSFSLVPKVVFGQDPARLPGSLQTNRTLDAWLRINADGSVTVFTGKVELGQGIVTALAQIAAEELEV